MQIKTVKLQEMMSKAIRGVGNNKLLPITTLIALEVKDNMLTITSTDATNFLYVRQEVESDDFYVCVQAEQFSKLVAKMTSENIALDVEDGSLVVKGNGTYTIALPMDEDGTMVKYPNPIATFEKSNSIGTLDVATIKTILTTIKPALSPQVDASCYAGYYVSDVVMATDNYKLNALDSSILSEPKLISAEMMNLLDVMSDSVEVYTMQDKLVMTSKDCAVYGNVQIGIEDFNVDVLRELVASEYPSMCKIPKANLLQLLDRIALFVGAFDDGAVTLTFADNGLMVSSKQLSGSETIPYLECNNFAPFVGMIDINCLQTQIKAQTCDVIELWFGEATAIKVVDGSITSVVALLVD